jgi:hypothetical protein
LNRPAGDGSSDAEHDYAHFRCAGHGPHLGRADEYVRVVAESIDHAG